METFVSMDIETTAPEDPRLWECAEKSLRGRGEDADEESCRRWLSTSPVVAEVQAVALWSGHPRPVRVIMRKPSMDMEGLTGLVTRNGVAVDVKLFASEWELLGTVNGLLDEMEWDWPLVTYSGRTFDLPCLMIRSIANKLRPAERVQRGMREKRWEPRLHVDLRDQLQAYGAAGNVGSFRLACLALIGKDPKATTDGGDVARLVRDGQFGELAAYVASDGVHTRELGEAIYSQLGGWL